MRLLLCALLLAIPVDGKAQFGPGALLPQKPAGQTPPGLEGYAPAAPAVPTLPAAPGTPGAPATPAVGGTSTGPVPATGAGVPTHSISFEVKVGRAGGASKMTQGASSTGGAGFTRETTSTSRERDKRSQLELEIVLRNFARRSDQVNVDWTFFCERVDENSYELGRGAKAPDSLLVLSQGAQEVAFKPGGTEKVAALSAEATMHESRSSTVSKSMTGGVNRTSVSAGVVKTGYKIVGWFTRVTADGQVLGIKASSPRFEAFARDEAALTALPRVANQAPVWAPPSVK